MSNIKKEVKSPKLIMSLVKKSQTKEMIITTTLIDNEFAFISVPDSKLVNSSQQCEK